MAYEKNTPWINDDAVNSPISAERLNHLETQYDEAVEYADDVAEGLMATTEPSTFCGFVVVGASTPVPPVGTLGWGIVAT